MKYNLLEFKETGNAELNGNNISLTISTNLYGAALPSLAKKVCKYLKIDKELETILNNPETNIEIDNEHNIQRVGLAYIPGSNSELERITPSAEKLLLVVQALNDIVEHISKNAMSLDDECNFIWESFDFKFGKKIEGYYLIEGQEIYLISKTFCDLFFDYIKLLPNFPPFCEITNFTRKAANAKTEGSDASGEEQVIESTELEPIKYIKSEKSIAPRKSSTKDESLEMTIKGELRALGFENHEKIVCIDKGKAKTVFISTHCKRYEELFSFKGKKTHLEIHLTRKDANHKKYFISSYSSY